MGDRANVFIKDPTKADPEAGVYLYTHWDGDGLAEVVQRALARKQRWNDGAYLARIVFCTMLKGEAKGDDVLGDETGFGIATGPPDNEHPIIEIDPKRNRIAFRPTDDDDDKQAHDAKMRLGGGWTFEEYVKLTPAKLKQAWK